MAEAVSPFHDCIQHCWTARDVCQKTLYTHCLETGGKHLEKMHVRIMTDCIAIAQAAADAMVRHSPLYAVFCAACAHVCESCAESCDAIDTETMRQVAAHCRACAKACHAMSQGGNNPLEAAFRQVEEEEKGAAH
jgi:hypothetical protein